ncbi:hypothetical protein ACJX0J_007754, partial [Zea mays]
ITTTLKEMPSLQKALPPELADNVLRLYRECLRRAKYIGHQKHNTELLVAMVRQQFKKNMHETDPEKIQKMKDDAARGLINHILYESEKITGRKFSAWGQFLQLKLRNLRKCLLILAEFCRCQECFSRSFSQENLIRKKARPEQMEGRTKGTDGDAEEFNGCDWSRWNEMWPGLLGAISGIACQSMAHYLLSAGVIHGPGPEDPPAFCRHAFEFQPLLSPTPITSPSARALEENCRSGKGRRTAIIADKGRACVAVVPTTRSLSLYSSMSKSPIQSYHVLQLVVVPSKLLPESAWNSSCRYVEWKTPHD